VEYTGLLEDAIHNETQGDMAPKTPATKFSQRPRTGPAKIGDVGDDGTSHGDAATVRQTGTRCNRPLLRPDAGNVRGQLHVSTPCGDELPDVTKQGDCTFDLEVQQDSGTDAVQAFYNVTQQTPTT